MPEDPGPVAPATTETGSLIPLATDDASSKFRSRSTIGQNQTPGKTVYHGVIRDHGGEKYKMQQLAHGVFSGVPIADWDDEVHMANHTVLDLPNTHISQPISPRSSSLDLLQPRAFRYGTCLPNVQCVYQVGTNVLVGIESTINTLIAAYNALKGPGGELWKFLNQPFVVAATVGVGSAYFSGWVAAKTTIANTPVSPCSSSLKDSDVITSAVRDTIAGWDWIQKGEISDLTVKIQLQSGESASISVNVRSNTHQTPEVCGAPKST